MSNTLTRKERRAEARAQRQERERAAADRARRRRRLFQVGGITAFVVAILAIAIAISQSGGGGPKVTAGKPAPGAAAVNARFAGIPQQGIAVGNPRAPVTLVELGDLQCPICRAFAQSGLPTLVDRYVRPGKLRIEFRNLTFIGPDSVTAARMAAAAGQQNRLWPFIDLFYADQGEENTGYVTDGFLRSIASGVSGLDVRRAFAARNSAAVTAQLGAATTLANRWGVTGTPSFLIGRTGGPQQRLVPSALTPDAFTPTIDRLARS